MTVSHLGWKPIKHSCKIEANSAEADTQDYLLDSEAHELRPIKDIDADNSVNRTKQLL